MTNQDTPKGAEGGRVAELRRRLAQVVAMAKPVHKGIEFRDDDLLPFGCLRRATEALRDAIALAASLQARAEAAEGLLREAPLHHHFFKCASTKIHCDADGIDTGERDPCDCGVSAWKVRRDAVMQTKGGQSRG
jgi:hypothetical protein